MQASKMSNAGNGDAQFPLEDGRNHSFLSGSSLEILILAVEIVVSIQPRRHQWSACLGEVPREIFWLGQILL